ncbi:MAG: FAD-dependent oxidoreductase [Actinomycetota bacterium]|nr:FAD-dependent oxidoreductase [Actinomycetota bacterium]
MERRADVVVVGAAVVGCAVAEHLTTSGMDDVVVVDQGPLPATGGSTSHAPGLVFQTNPSKTMTALARYSVERYSELRRGGRSCFHPVGGIEVAATSGRWDDLKRKHGIATSWGLESALLAPEEVAEKIPILDPGRIQGGYFVATDGIARAVDACAALADGARAEGARFYGETPVTGIDVARGRVRAVETSRGRIEADLVVLCAGVWGPLLGRMAGVSIPLHPVEHQLVWTTPLPQLTGETEEIRHPILRHQDSCMYFRQRGESYGVGSYQHDPLLVSPADIRSHADAPVMPTVLDFTPEHFEPAWRDARDLLPALRDAEIAEPMNAIFSFTPDGNPLLGEAREVGGLWLAEAIWITHALGAGRAVAEWIAQGEPPLDLRECDVNRFEPYATSPAYVRRRAAQAYDEVYDIIHPLQPMEEPRPLRVSPFYPSQHELGAFFLEANGWERPHWFEKNANLLGDRAVPARDPWSARYWSPIVAGEALTTREVAGLYDMTSLKRAEVTGPRALECLERLTTNPLDREPGYVTYTLMLDERGGIRSDVTIARLGEERFQAGLNGIRDIDWIRRHAPRDGSVHVRDITAGTCCIGLWGPLARDIVQPLTDDDFSNEAFRFFRARDVYIREVPVTALRLSYVGELGWELYTSADYGLRLWDLLWEAGRAHGVVAAGRGAFNALRLEKGYRSWGIDMWSEHDPWQAGLEFTVKLDKGDFVGREALERRLELHRAKAASQRLVCLVLADPARVVMGKEPVFADGRAVGFVTSADYGYTIGRGIAYAWIPEELSVGGTRLEIEYFGERYEAAVAADPLFDPEMTRMRR